MKSIPFLVTLLLLAGTASAAQQIKIDTTKANAPISKYIYGQFIEHLGKCIYGGIWAEMLEDRKFYYPITDDYKPFATASDRNWNTGPYQYLNASPWKVIGKAGTVVMQKQSAFVGQHTPAIQLPGDGTAAGISQEGLALVKGKEYVGRIILAGDQAAAPIVVQLVPDNGPAIVQEIAAVSGGFQAYPLKYTAAASSDNVRIEIISKGKGTFRVGTLSLMPADNIKGWRPEVVALLKELDAPVYRWPGGNFVSGYNWRDGIGERDKRPPRKNPAWKGVEHNDVGIHEYMELMEMLGADPFVSVNTGLGTVEEVAEEIEYINGAADTRQGKLRTTNGHAAPWGVKWWAVGNEMYGNWQLGNIPLAEYVKKHNRVAEAMWKVDPKAQLIAVGSLGRWDQSMLSVCANFMSLISEHIYCKENRDVVQHVAQLATQIKRVGDAHRGYRKTIAELAGKDIRIAMDEWNYWYGDYIYGELGVRYHLKDGLGVAKGLHEYFRNSDIFFMANYAQTVNVIGCIKTSRTDAAFETTGLALKLYRKQFGVIPLDVAGVGGNLDVAAAWTADKKAITVGIVNPTAAAEALAIDAGAVRFAPNATRWVIAHADPMAYNEPGKAANVTIREEAATIGGDGVQVPPYSVVVYRLETK